MQFGVYLYFDTVLDENGEWIEVLVQERVYRDFLHKFLETTWLTPDNKLIEFHHTLLE